MSIETKNRSFPIDRRGFLKVAAGTLGALGASAAGLSLIGRASRLEEAGDSRVFETTDEILLRIKEKYGVEILGQNSDKYFERIYSINPQGEKELLEAKPTTVLTRKEANIVAESLKETPGAGHLVQLIIPFRYSEQGEIPEASYLGNQWQALLHATIFPEQGPFQGQTFMHSTDYVYLPADFSVSDNAAIRIVIPEGAEMTDSLPRLRESSSSLLNPFLLKALNSAEISRFEQIEVPWSTHGEKLKQVLVRETGMALLDKGSINREPTLLGKGTFDIENPLLKAFAQVNRWKLVPYGDFLRQYYGPATGIFLGDSAKDAQRLVWDRDTRVWGNLKNRKLRLSPQGSYGTIQKAFSEFWMASILYPGLLTSKERAFFQKIHEGLRKNPDAFIKKADSDWKFLID